MLVHTSGNTTDIYIEESVPTSSDFDIKLPPLNFSSP